MDPENQLTDQGQDPHSDCGEACVLSVLTDAGRRVSMRTIEQACAAAGADLSVGTTAAVLAQVFGAFGISARADHVFAVAPLISAGEANGCDRWLVEIHSDAYGNPGGELFHWVLTDGRAVMNPIGGHLIPNLPAYLKAATGDVVEVLKPIGGTISTAAGAAPNLPPLQQPLDPADVRRAFARLGWWGIGRFEPDVAGVEERANAESVDSILFNLRDAGGQAGEGYAFAWALAWVRSNLSTLQELAAAAPAVQQLTELRGEVEQLRQQLAQLSVVNPGPRPVVTAAPDPAPSPPPISEPAAPAAPSSDHMETHPR